MSQFELRAGVVFVGIGLLSACGLMKGPDDLTLSDPKKAVEDARRMIDEKRADPEKYKDWLNNEDLPPSLRVSGLHHAFVHGDHLDLVLGRSPDDSVGGRIWAREHTPHQDEPTRYPDVFFFRYTNDAPETPSNRP